MTSQPLRTPVARRLLTRLLAACPLLAIAGQQAISGELAKSQLRSEAATGMTIHIDPQTGATVKTPTPGTVPLRLTPQEQQGLNTSDQGLVEVPGSQPGGGIKVDLQGRFQSPLVGTVDGSGKFRMQHLGDASKGSDKK